MIEDLEFSVIQKQLMKLDGGPTTYAYLLEHLVSANPLIKGAPVLVPETVLFRDKKPQCLLAYSVKTNEIKCWPSHSPLQLPQLLKVMMTRYRARKKPPELRTAVSLILTKVTSSGGQGEVSEGLQGLGTCNPRKAANRHNGEPPLA